MKEKKIPKPEVQPFNCFVPAKQLKQIDEDIKRCYPLLRRSDFISNLIKSYYSGTAGWASIDKLSDDKEDKEPRRSYK